MLKVIEEDADSFAKRAEMYYKKRPELINMVEDFYRAHRSLAEQYDLFKLDRGNRLSSPWITPAMLGTKSQSERSMSMSKKSYDSYSDAYKPEESYESEVDDPDPEDEEEETVVQVQTEMQKVEVSSVVVDDEVMKLKEETERLKLENRVQREKQIHYLLRDYVTGFHKRKKKRRREANLQIREADRRRRIELRKKRKLDRDFVLYGGAPPDPDASQDEIVEDQGDDNENEPVASFSEKIG